MIASDSRVTTQFSEVALKIDPWDKPAASLGFYSTNSLATRVADFVRNTFSEEFNGGLDVSVVRRSTRNEIKQYGEKIGFIDSPPDRMAAIYTISNELDREEVVRIVNWISTFKEINPQSAPFSSTPADHPVSLRTCDCYVMYKLPITTNKKPLGIYSSENALHSVINFFSLMNIDYYYESERRDVVVFASGSKAAFTQNSKQEPVEDQTLMRVANKLDFLGVKQIIRSLGYEESDGHFRSGI